METDILPFPIGIEYENLEFELEVLPEKIKGYDSYIYVGKKVKNFLNYPTEKLELIFHWDILQAVIIKQIDFNPKQKLLKYFEVIEENEKFSIYQNEEIQLYIIKASNNILYGKPDVISSILPTLLC